tara:strand:- start:153 stop:368 length:216 start_codon:yes stop_codon:yes gene_type:complete
MNTETGSILKDLRKSKKRENDRIKLACLYARDHKLSLKDVGIYEFPNGHLIFDRYPSTRAKALLEKILDNE